jgi:DNA helicase-2/ATP-dependent DNA helicase PcrA
MYSLETLNSRQKEAVLATEGAVLVLAGAGTGKTRVITLRIANLIAQGVPPWSILAVTFTNKAAGEMRERINSLAGSSGMNAGDVWISTFHSFCARLLRRETQRAGLPRDFAIYDDEDQLAAIRMALREFPSDDSTTSPRSIRERISHAKSAGKSPEYVASAASDLLEKRFAKIYAAYEAILTRNSAVDFDDLLIRAVRLFRNNPETRAAWQQRFQYLLVDEFQDTNTWQAELVRLLANDRRNVCVVGDEDQSIYSWRGAMPGNMLAFTEEFPGTKIIRLEHNYRSTQTILDAATAVVSRNSGRLGKTLLATKATGELLRFFEARDAIDEAQFVGGEIARLLRAAGPGTSVHAAILYRTAAQSRVLEEALRRHSIRYRVVGGLSFYHRAEVKDALSYLRVVLHPEDDIALLRIINVPARGIGKTTIAALQARASDSSRPIWEILAESSSGSRGAALISFRNLIEEVRTQASTMPPGELLRMILERSSYLTWVAEMDRLEHTSRSENVFELLNAITSATERGETIEEILDSAALVSDADEFDADVPLSLMTLHSAKGLEFDHVFLVGLEEGLFPHGRSLGDKDQIEEERRLCYVGMTRARETLTLTRAVFRRLYGSEQLGASEPSRFLSEIPSEQIEILSDSGSFTGEGSRYDADGIPEDISDWPLKRPSISSSHRRECASESSSSRTRSVVGTRVVHPTYGEGTVLAVEGEGNDRKFTVSFPVYGTKKLVERYAKLEFA